ncbi:M23 family metallopeptidase [Nocardia amamiensis]|uniref:M23 family metallopeptidase n=1 Tax=Nocardia amamiensis TaxID=404578 RepID=A0ABS0D457_9NOCA|nr:M23 family metallopeptidase [Nocardia amamiensis]MBF6301903.1 M23 family metallopeptidase [Nocardia amamiensis]
MNHRSTFASDDRLRSGHRYRQDDESYGGATPYAAAPIDGYRDSRYVAGSQYEYHAAADQGPGFATDHASFEPPVHDAAYDHAAYDPAAYQSTGYDGSWAENNAWAQQDWSQQDSWSDGGAWNSGEAWAEEQPWTPEANEWVAEDTGCWAPEESWASETAEPDVSDTGAELPAVPTVIPARRSANKRGGAHRVPAPPAALKGRAAVAAVAAGAVVAAGQAAFASPEQPSQTVDYEAAGQIHEIAAQSMNVADPSASPESPQVLNVSAPANLDQFNDILQKGQKYAEDLAAQESAKLRPLFHKFFAAGNFTSGFGARWGVQHLGIDIAGPIGTPIYAVADGTVIEAGPAAGFGMWVRLLHDDGTVTIYGHIDTATVSQGQRVLAGDQIATMGNRGFSTGPHCHFEVWLNGVDKVDPVPWLATRGIGLGQMRD